MTVGEVVPVRARDRCRRRFMIGSQPGEVGTNASTHLLRVLNATCDGATWADASSRTLKQDIAPLSTEAARETVMALEPVSFAYRQSPEDARLGFIAEDVPEAVAMPDRQSLSSLDIVAALTKVVQEQERQLARQRETIARQSAELSAQEQAFRTQAAVLANVLERLSALERGSMAGQP